MTEEQPTATRDELIELTRKITSEAKLLPGRKRSKFVKIPAWLFEVAHEVIRRELLAIAASEKGESDVTDA